MNWKNLLLWTLVISNTICNIIAFFIILILGIWIISKIHEWQFVDTYGSAIHYLKNKFREE